MTRSISRALGYKTDPGGDQCNAYPARGRDLFLQPEPGEQRNRDIGKRRRRQYEGQVRPGERRQIAADKTSSTDTPPNTQGVRSADRSASG